MTTRPVHKTTAMHVLMQWVVGLHQVGFGRLLLLLNMESEANRSNPSASSCGSRGTYNYLLTHLPINYTANLIYQKMLFAVSSVAQRRHEM